MEVAAAGGAPAAAPKPKPVRRVADVKALESGFLGLLNPRETPTEDDVVDDIEAATSTIQVGRPIPPC